MRHVLLLTLAVLWYAVPVNAQAPPVNKEPLKPEPQDFARYTLKVKPTRPPLPSLKYELIPSPLERNHTNAALLYYRALIMNAETRSREPQFSKMQTEVLEALERPLAETSKELLRKYATLHTGTIRELEAAAKSSHCDWGMMQRIQDDGIGVLLPEVQQMRELAYALRVQARLHMLDGKLDAALRDIQTGLTMGHHVGNGSTFIQFLVGVAISTMFIVDLEHVLQMENCPNLYWSLTALPRPLVDIRKPIEGEMRAMEKYLVFPKDLEKGPLTTDQANASLEKIFATLGNFNDEPSPEKTILQTPSYNRMLMAGYVTMHYANARKALLAAGKTDADIDAMPAAQVVLLDAMIQCRNVRDEYFVWINAPYAEGIDGMAKAVAKFRGLKRNPLAIPQQLLYTLLPAVDRIYNAEIRIMRRIASLRTVEAVRYHVATTGALPKKLSDITVVTVPVDPLTNQPFEYSVDGNTFTVHVAAPPGDNNHRASRWKYQVTVTK